MRGTADQEQPLAQARRLRADAAWLWRRSAEVRAKAHRLCLASDARLRLDPRYRQEAKRRLLQDAYRGVLADEVQDLRTTQYGRRRGDCGSSSGRAVARGT